MSWREGKQSNQYFQIYVSLKNGKENPNWQIMENDGNFAPTLWIKGMSSVRHNTNTRGYIQLLQFS